MEENIPAAIYNKAFKDYRVIVRINLLMKQVKIKILYLKILIRHAKTMLCEYNNPFSVAMRSLVKGRYANSNAT